MTREIHVATDRSFSPDEYAELMPAVHRDEPSDYPADTVTAALHSYHFIGHVRDEAGLRG